MEQIERQGWTLARAAEAAGVSVRTISKWRRRFREEGELGLPLAARHRRACCGGRPGSASS